MKLINRVMAFAFQIEKVSPYELLQGELQLKEKEQALRWEISVQIIEAVLLGKLKVEVLEASKKEGTELLGDSLLLVKIQGEPALGPVPLMNDHGRMVSQDGLHCWFEADLENGEKNGIFITNKDVVEVTVLAPWMIQTGNLVPKIRVTIEADLCRTIREGAFKS